MWTSCVVVLRCASSRASYTASWCHGVSQVVISSLQCKRGLHRVRCFCFASMGREGGREKGDGQGRNKLKKAKWGGVKETAERKMEEGTGTPGNQNYALACHQVLATGWMHKQVGLFLLFLLFTLWAAPFSIDFWKADVKRVNIVPVRVTLDFGALRLSSEFSCCSWILTSLWPLLAFLAAKCRRRKKMVFLTLLAKLSRPSKTVHHTGVKFVESL